MEIHSLFIGLVVFLFGLTVLGLMSSALELTGRLKSPDRLPSGEEDQSEIQPWDCPSCRRSIEPTSDTCPWCGWTHIASGDEAAPGDLDSEEGAPPAEEEGVSELVPETDELEGGEEIHAEKGPPSKSSLSLAEAVQAISGEDVIGGDRDRLIKSLVGTHHAFEMTVKRVQRTIGMYSEPEYRNGRTVSGTIGGTDIEVSVLFPVVSNEEIDSVEPGSTLLISGIVSDWDGLRKQPRMRVEVT